MLRDGEVVDVVVVRRLCLSSELDRRRKRPDERFGDVSWTGGAVVLWCLEPKRPLLRCGAGAGAGAGATSFLEPKRGMVLFLEELVGGSSG